MLNNNNNITLIGDCMCIEGEYNTYNAQGQQIIMYINTM